MMNKSEAPGTITINEKLGEKNQEIHLKRLEVNEGEQQLGIILPLNGSYCQERKRRWQQS